jgi:hypothetical protein
MNTNDEIRGMWDTTHRQNFSNDIDTTQWRNSQKMPEVWDRTTKKPEEDEKRRMKKNRNQNEFFQNSQSRHQTNLEFLQPQTFTDRDSRVDRQGVEVQTNVGKNILKWFSIVLIVSCVIAALVIGSRSFMYFTTWTLVLELIAVGCCSFGWCFLLPWAFVQSMSIFMVTILIASDPQSHAWFVANDEKNAYIEYVLAHVVAPIFLAVVLYTIKKPRTERFDFQYFWKNVWLCTCIPFIPLMLWSILYNPKEVYKTTTNIGYMILTFAGSSIVSSIIAIWMLGVSLL